MRLTSLLLVLATAIVAGQADLNPESRARLPYLQRKDMDEKVLPVFNTLPGLGKDGVLKGPLAFAAYNPAVAKALFDLHNAAVAGSLNPHDRELARTSVRTTPPWWHSVPCLNAYTFGVLLSRDRMAGHRLDG